MAFDISPVIGLAIILTLGITAEWLAWRFAFPSICALLIFGLIIGPVTGVLQPDKIFDGLLFPLVSISVAIILFEGGLSLSFSELPKVGRIVWNLVTVGAVVTWIGSAAAAHIILGFAPFFSVLLGAILMVTGPTVIGPLLRHIRPAGPAASILKWEGILIDPIGAVLAALVLETMVTGGLTQAAGTMAMGLFRTVIAGSLTGVLGGYLIVFTLRYYWLPDFLHSSVSLMMIVIVFTVSNWFQAESGFLAATAMGIVLANQQHVNTSRIVLFKENLRVILISSLFIVLAARLDLKDFASLEWNTVFFLSVLIVIIRPAAVALSTLRSNLRFRERLFLSFMAPRGIVAAAVASLFSIELVHRGVLHGEELVSVTFFVILGTVFVYGATAPLIARLSGLAVPNPQGVLMVGAHSWARVIGSALREAGFQVIFIDNSFANIAAARSAGFAAHQRDILSPLKMDDMEMNGIGHLLCMTPNDGVNSLACLRFSNRMEISKIHQLPPAKQKSEKGGTADHLKGRLLFASDAVYARLNLLFQSGAQVKKMELTKETDYDGLKKHFSSGILPLFLITGGKEKELVVFTTDRPPAPKPGQILLSLIFPEKK